MLYSHKPTIINAARTLLPYVCRTGRGVVVAQPGDMVCSDGEREWPVPLDEFARLYDGVQVEPAAAEVAEPEPETEEYDPAAEAVRYIGPAIQSALDVLAAPENLSKVAALQKLFAACASN